MTTDHLKPQNKARAKRLLDEKIRFSDGISTYREKLNSDEFEYKKVRKRKYRLDGKGELKNPKTEYCFFRSDGTFITVEKLVFRVADLPDHTKKPLTVRLSTNQPITQ